MKRISMFLVFLFLVSLVLIGCGGQNEVKMVESELIGKFVYEAELGSRTIRFKGDGTYTEVVENILTQMHYEGTYEVEKGKLILTSEDGNVDTWTYTYNSANGNLVLYNGDWAYTKK